MDVLLIDDHRLFRDGLGCLLQAIDPQVRLTGVGRLDEGLALVRERRFDAIMLDYHLAGAASGLEAIAAMSAAAPGVPLCVISGECRVDTMRATYQAGATGFIPKDSSPEVLRCALKIVLDAGTYVPPQMLDATPGTALARAASLGARTDPPPALSQRQRGVLERVIQGKPNKVIARELDIAEGTVKAHLSAVLRSLGAANRTEAVFAAARRGLV